MRQMLVTAMHVLGVLAIAAVLFAVLAAPGFLSSQSSTINLQTVAEIVRR